MEKGQRLPRPRKRRAKQFSVQDKEQILNIFRIAAEQNPENTKSENVAFTAKSADVSINSVYNILREYIGELEVQLPKSYHRKRAILDNIDENTKCRVKSLVHSLFEKNESTTTDNILAAVHRDENILHFQRSTLACLLEEIGFKYSKKSRHSVLLEKHEVVVRRRNYQKQINKYRQEGTKIYFLDETLINPGHTVSKAFVGDFTPILQNPFEKENNLLVLHIGSEDGFVEGRLLVSHPKKVNEEISSEVFEEWFKTTLGFLENNSVIVLDNASCHSKQIEKIPNAGTKREDIQEWLTRHSIHYEERMLRVELLDLVRKSGITPKFVVDEIANEQNKTVLRLPPFHFEFNPMEYIWRQIKTEVSKDYKTLEMKNLLPAFHNAVKNVTAVDWKNAIKRAISEEERLWKLDYIMEARIESLMAQFGDNSSSSSSSEVED